MMNAAEYAHVAAMLQDASKAYYSDGSSQMSDAEYDARMIDVAAYEAANGITDGLASKVAAGAVVSGDVEHSAPMLSLDNVFTSDELSAFIKRTGITAFAVEPKLDGLAVAIRYVDGVPVQMVTRGDGLHGEDVTFALAQIANLPVRVSGSAYRRADLSNGGLTGEVRGEVLFTKHQFLDANDIRVAHGDKPFANARNGAAGALRGAKDRAYDLPLSFFAYDQTRLVESSSHTEAMEALAGFGFATAASLIAQGPFDIEGAATQVANLDAARHGLPVETDGVVIKADLASDRDRLGAGSKSPRWAVAYKFAAVGETSVLRDILWQVGRTGVITPRAVIDPTVVNGVTITYATLHNPGDIARKGFLLGDHVSVVRAGEVIPRLEAPLPDLRDGSQTPIDVPTVCPRCGGPIDDSQARLRCERGRVCGLTESITYAVGRDALDIEGLGPKQVQALVESGAVLSVADLFSPALTTEVLVESGNVAPANAPKILTQIDKARSAIPARVITALGLALTGRSMSRRLAARFATLSGLREATVEQLADVDGIGAVKAASIHAELGEVGDVVDRLIADSIGEAPATASPVRSGQPRMALDDSTTPATLTDGHSDAGVEDLTGKSVVFTGKMVGPLAGYGRTEMQELAESISARAASSVSKNTDLLVVGENAGSKKAKALELGVRTVTEAEFAAMIGRG